MKGSERRRTTTAGYGDEKGGRAWLKEGKRVGDGESARESREGELERLRREVGKFNALYIQEMEKVERLEKQAVYLQEMLKAAEKRAQDCERKLAEFGDVTEE